MTVCNLALEEMGVILFIKFAAWVRTVFGLSGPVRDHRCVASVDPLEQRSLDGYLLPWGDRVVPAIVHVLTMNRHLGVGLRVVSLIIPLTADVAPRSSVVHPS